MERKTFTNKPFHVFLLWSHVCRFVIEVKSSVSSYVAGVIHFLRTNHASCEKKTKNKKQKKIKKKLP